MIPTAILALAAATAAPPPVRLQVDLWTMGPGDHPYERFGHAALRVRNGNEDLLYNFGVADFGRSDFIVDFLRDRSGFWLEVESPEDTLDQFKRRDRSVYVQRLRLAPERLRWLADRLRENALPENRDYAYHHFKDNCSTRVRDLLDEAAGGRLSELRRVRTGKTLRTHVREGFSDSMGLLIATELLGRPLDIKPDRWERMFLPDALREEVVEAKVAIPPTEIYARKAPPPNPGDPRSARRLLWIIAGAAAVILYVGARRGGVLARLSMACAGVFSTTLAVPMGLVALLSRQGELRFNENLLVFWPTDILLLAGHRPYARAYLRVRAGISLLLVLYHAGGLLVQDNLPLLALGVALTAAVDLGLRRSS